MNLKDIFNSCLLIPLALFGSCIGIKSQMEKAIDTQDERMSEEIKEVAISIFGGRSTIVSRTYVITKDSVGYSLIAHDRTKNVEKGYPNTRQAWEQLLDSIDLEDFRHIHDGESHQEYDGNDTEISIIALANVQQYNATLSNQVNWTWRQLNDFLLNTNSDNLIVFDTGYEEEWTFEFLFNKETNKSYFRKFEQSIEITDERLYLVNWTDLTSSLQFEDTALPGKDDCNLFVKLGNGFYRLNHSFANAIL